MNGATAYALLFTDEQVIHIFGTPKSLAVIQLAKPTNSGSEPATVLRP